jgi:hypothetical protein
LSSADAELTNSTAATAVTGTLCDSVNKTALSARAEALERFCLSQGFVDLAEHWILKPIADRLQSSARTMRSEICLILAT